MSTNKKREDKARTLFSPFCTQMRDCLGKALQGGLKKGATDGSMPVGSAYL
jgi:hypothetical protein